MDGGTVEASTPPRPQPAKSMSFSRLDSPRTAPKNRSRASTLQGGGIPEILLQSNHFSTSPEREKHNGDPFSSHDDDDRDPDDIGEVAGLPQRLEDLPIEIRSLTERYVSVYDLELVFSSLAASYHDHQS